MTRILTVEAKWPYPFGQRGVGVDDLSGIVAEDAEILAVIFCGYGCLIVGEARDGVYVVDAIADLIAALEVQMRRLVLAFGEFDAENQRALAVLIGYEDRTGIWTSRGSAADSQGPWRSALNSATCVAVNNFCALAAKGRCPE